MRKYLFTALALLFTIFAFAFSGGNGTASAPYQIGTPEELSLLANNVNGGNDYTSDYFKLTNDIDLNGIGWAPIGWHYPFNGHFDCDGFTISNLTIDNNDYDFVGLFGKIGTNGKISNLRLKDVNIVCTINNASFAGVGGLAGYNDGIITNCSVTGEVEGNKGVSDIYVGGLVGLNHNNGSIENCYAKCIVYSNGADVSVGGLIGANYNSIKNCYAISNVAGSGFGQVSVGGFVGWNNQGPASIENCYVAGQVTHTSSTTFLGSFAGYNYNGTIGNCYSSAPTFIGGGVNTGVDNIEKIDGQLENLPEEFWTLVENDYPSLYWEFHTIIFNVNGGTTVENKSIKHEEHITAEPSTTKTGHTLEGWYKEATFTTEWDFDTDVVIGNMTLYAKWELNSYAISFETNGGTAVTNQTIEHGDKISQPTTTKTDYTLVGWYKEAAFTNEWNFDTDVVEGDMTLYAKWELNSYAITFETNGGTAVTNQTIEHGEKITRPSTTMVGYNFVGWYKENDFTTEWDFDTDVVVESMALYAKWELNIIPIYHEVNLVNNDRVNLSNSRWGIHGVLHGYDLQFTATATEGYAGYSLSVYANGRRLTPVYEDIYMVEDIVSDIQVTFILTNDKTSNEAISAAKVWTNSGSIHITSPTQAEVKIVGISGSIVYAAKTNEATVSVPSGIYIVTVGNDIRKVIVP